MTVDEVTVHEARQVASDVEAKADGLGTAVAGVGAVEGLEDLALVLQRDPVAVVEDCEAYPLVDLTDVDLDAVTAISSGIADKAADDLASAAAAAIHPIPSIK